MVLNTERLTEYFPAEIRNKTRMSTLGTSIQHCTGGSDPGQLGNIKEIKGTLIRKEEIKLYSQAT